MTEPKYPPETEELDQPDPAREQALPLDSVDLPATVHGEVEAAEADVLDQARTVEFDEDDDEDGDGGR